MKKLYFVCPILIALGGCATNPIPANYSGPIATIRDSVISETSNRAQFFYLSKFDDQLINNVLSATQKANRGRGFSLSTVPYVRDVPARQSTLKLEARIGYGAPIQELLNSGTIYTAEKTIQFAPESNKIYVVKGVLSAEKKDVWLEDAETGKRIE